MRGERKKQRQDSAAFTWRQNDENCAIDGNNNNKQPKSNHRRGYMKWNKNENKNKNDKPKNQPNSETD